MTEIRNVESDLSRFRARVLVAGLFVVMGFLLLMGRLVVLQVVRYDSFLEQAESNRTAVVPVVPNRGLILDRNGVVLASNYSAYTIEITPSKAGDLEDTIDRLSQVVDIQARDRRRFKKLLEESRNFESLPIRTRLSEQEVAKFAAQHFRFPGVEIKARLFRNYPFGSVASHVIGYIGRVNQAEKDRIEESEDDSNYRGTEYIGKLGIEQSYEQQLHGMTGVEEVETSAGGRAVRRLASNPATPGNTVVLSLDIKLQKMIEDLFGDRRGALVAIEPKTGEVLAFVSVPTFDPNLFVEGIDSENWKDLNESPDKPLLNRALRGTYPPGSTYKPFMALAALETGVRTPGQAISDPGYFDLGPHRFRDDKEGGHGYVDMYKSIVQSCDTYYYRLANDMGVDLMHAQMAPFGFGQLTGIDILGESRGILPSTEWKRNAYKRPEQKRWYAGETISLGIGQGYNNFTMLQLAHATATLSNDGLKMRPHLVREIMDIVTRERQTVAKDPVAQLPLKPANIDTVRRALIGVNIEGTSAASFRGAPYVSAGKTGTAQVVQIKKNEKYDADRMDERHRDHALFMAFAPAQNPQLALAVIVENAGFGAQSAAPIARRVFDYVLLGKYPSVDDINGVVNGTATAPIGAQRLVSDIPLPIEIPGARSPAAAASDAAMAAAANASQPKSLAQSASPTTAQTASQAASQATNPTASHPASAQAGGAQQTSAQATGAQTTNVQASSTLPAATQSVTNAPAATKPTSQSLPQTVVQPAVQASAHPASTPNLPAPNAQRR